jgi:hypothetical protein
MRLTLLMILLLAGAGDSYLGRWDLTVTSGARQYPSWLEVRRVDGKLEGRFVGRSGSVRPAEIRLEGEDLHVALQRPRNAKPEIRGESLRGRLVGGKLEGTGTDRDGKPVRWAGVKVERPPAPRGEPKWGAPVELFNGRDLSGWEFRDPRGRECWSVSGGAIVNSPPCPDIISTRRFRDFKLHVEYNLDAGSNSGVYLRGRYEVQIADSEGRDLGPQGSGAVYGFLTPTAPAAKKAGEWQTFDITLVGYHVTVVYNGRTVIDKQEIDGITGAALDSDEAAPGPIMLQGDHGRVQFRKIVVTPSN